MWYTYILKCGDGSYYVGITNDLNRRVKEHFKGNASQYTMSRRPVTLQYSENFKFRKDAEKREKQLKGWSKAKKEALINENISKLKQLSKAKS